MNEIPQEQKTYDESKVVSLKDYESFQWYEETTTYDPDWHPVDQANEEYSHRKSVDALDSVDEINQFVTYFLDRGRFRDAFIVVLQNNTGLRISDVLWLRWKDIFRPDGSAYKSNRIKIQKTGHKRTIEFYFNDAVVAAANLYKDNMSRFYDPEEYIFISEAYNKGHTPLLERKKDEDERVQDVRIQPLRVETVSRMMTKAAKEAGLSGADRRISSHSFRKDNSNAFDNLLDGYELGEDLEKRAGRIQLAQYALGHRRATTTENHYLKKKLHMEACMSMNFGLAAINAYKERMANNQ